MKNKGRSARRSSLNTSELKPQKDSEEQESSLKLEEQKKSQKQLKKESRKSQNASKEIEVIEAETELAVKVITEDIEESAVVKEDTKNELVDKKETLPIGPADPEDSVKDKLPVNTPIAKVPSDTSYVIPTATKEKSSADEQEIPSSVDLITSDEQEIKTDLVTSLDADLKKIQASKYSIEREQQAREWIEQILETKLQGPFAESLKDGIHLCNLINKLLPRWATKLTPAKSKFKFKQMENIHLFLMALEIIKVPSFETFQTIDLFEEKNVNQVIDCLFSVSRCAEKNLAFKGPYLGPRLSLGKAEREKETKLQAEALEKEKETKLQAEALEKEKETKLQAEALEKEKETKLQAEAHAKLRLLELEANERLKRIESEATETVKQLALEAEAMQLALETEATERLKRISMEAHAARKVLENQAAEKFKQIALEAKADQLRLEKEAADMFKQIALVQEDLAAAEMLKQITQVEENLDAEKLEQITHVEEDLDAEKLKQITQDLDAEKLKQIIGVEEDLDAERLKEITHVEEDLAAENLKQITHDLDAEKLKQIICVEEDLDAERLKQITHVEEDLNAEKLKQITQVEEVLNFKLIASGKSLEIVGDQMEHSKKISKEMIEKNTSVDTVTIVERSDSEISLETAGDQMEHSNEIPKEVVEKDTSVDTLSIVESYHPIQLVSRDYNDERETNAIDAEITESDKNIHSEPTLAKSEKVIGEVTKIQEPRPVDELKNDTEIGGIEKETDGSIEKESASEDIEDSVTKEIEIVPAAAGFLSYFFGAAKTIVVKNPETPVITESDSGAIEINEVSPEIGSTQKNFEQSSEKDIEPSNDIEHSTQKDIFESPEMDSLTQDIDETDLEPSTQKDIEVGFLESPKFEEIIQDVSKVVDDVPLPDITSVDEVVPSGKNQLYLVISDSVVITLDEKNIEDVLDEIPAKISKRQTKKLKKGKNQGVKEDDDEKDEEEATVSGSLSEQKLGPQAVEVTTADESHKDLETVSDVLVTSIANEEIVHQSPEIYDIHDYVVVPKNNDNPTNASEYTFGSSRSIGSAGDKVLKQGMFYLKDSPKSTLSGTFERSYAQSNLFPFMPVEEGVPEVMTPEKMAMILKHLTSMTSLKEKELKAKEKVIELIAVNACFVSPVTVPDSMVKKVESNSTLDSAEYIEIGTSVVDSINNLSEAPEKSKCVKDGMRIIDLVSNGEISPDPIQKGAEVGEESTVEDQPDEAVFKENEPEFVQGPISLEVDSKIEDWVDEAKKSKKQSKKNLMKQLMNEHIAKDALKVENVNKEVIPLDTDKPSVAAEKKSLPKSLIAFDKKTANQNQEANSDLASETIVAMVESYENFGAVVKSVEDYIFIEKDPDVNVIDNNVKTQITPSEQNIEINSGRENKSSMNTAKEENMNLSPKDSVGVQEESMAEREPLPEASPETDEHKVSDETQNNEIENPICDLCAIDQDAVVQCVECCSKLCALHHDTHLITRLTFKHSLVPLKIYKTEPLSKNDIDPFEDREREKVRRQSHDLLSRLHLGNSRAPKLEKKCEMHNSKVMNKYCTQCETACCSECAFMGSHDGHIVRYLKDIVPGIKAEFTQLLPSVKNGLTSLLDLDNEILGWSRELGEMHENSINEVTIEYEAKIREIQLRLQTQKDNLSEAFKNTKNILLKKQNYVKKKIMLSNEYIEQCDSLLKSDSYDIPKKANELVKLNQQLGFLTKSDFLSELKMIEGTQVQYPTLGKYTNELHLTDYKLIKSVNPFKDYKIDRKTQDFEVQFEFLKSSFEGLGFNEKPASIQFICKWRCHPCNAKIEFIHEDSVVDHGDKVLVTSKGRMKSECEHHWKWATKKKSLMFFKFMGVKYSFNVLYNLDRA
jgi:uncharacterized phage-associated protein